MENKKRCLAEVFYTMHWNVDKHHQAPKITDGQTDKQLVLILGYTEFLFMEQYIMASLTATDGELEVYSELDFMLRDHQDGIVSLLKIAVCHCRVL